MSTLINLHRYVLWYDPAHAGIIGKELTYQTDKEASQLPIATEIPVMSQDTHPSIMRVVKEKWQQHWTNVHDIHSNKLKEINPEIGCLSSGCSLSRKTETRVDRLRIVIPIKHAYLPYPKCETCNCNLAMRLQLGNETATWQ